jgi:hypothetical protein
MTVYDKIKEALQELRGEHRDGGCESCGYGSGFYSDTKFGEYVQWHDIEYTLNKLKEEDANTDSNVRPAAQR